MVSAEPKRTVLVEAERQGRRAGSGIPSHQPKVERIMNDDTFIDFRGHAPRTISYPVSQGRTPNSKSGQVGALPTQDAILCPIPASGIEPRYSVFRRSQTIEAGGFHGVIAQAARASALQAEGRGGGTRLLHHLSRRE